jgi:energy-coupling factor transporter ATP-binding protein EcfA2
MALHAAALHAPTGAVMLAGSSGHGKTTLAALLNAHGWPSIADDIVLLESDGSEIQGLALAYAVKSGSWSVLQGQFPSLDQYHPRLRPDGRTVKYVAPHSVANNAGGLSVSTLVFPRYAFGSGLNTRQGSKITSLINLLREAINGRRYLTASGFLAICKLVDHANIVEVEYGCAAEAAEFLVKTFG